MTHTLIANTGIHIFATTLVLDMRDRSRMWFHEWYDQERGEWVLDIAHEVQAETGRYLYNKKELHDRGYLSETFASPQELVGALTEEGIRPICVDEDMQTSGHVYSMTLSDRHNTLSAYEGRWLPIPYFFRRTERYFCFGALNWSRFKLMPEEGEAKGGVRRYTVLLAFDTRAGYSSDRYEEYPVFPDENRTEMAFGVCSHEFMLMDYVSPHKEWSYVNDYLFGLAHPEVADVSKLRGEKHLNYVASYVHLMQYIAERGLLPDVRLLKSDDVETRDVDLVVDIGNSRTTALLVEGEATMNEVEILALTDYTRLLTYSDGEPEICRWQEPFDMRLAFRRVSLGDIGIRDSRQFVYPSFVRLGREATYLIHRATERDTGEERLTTHSSPKRYLWDGRRSRHEWKFLVLEGERDEHVLHLPGLSEMLRSDGRVARTGEVAGLTYHYSRRSLMTLAILEMLVQALTQVNSHRYRVDHGEVHMPRRIRRMVLTGPTTLSREERRALVQCGADAARLLQTFYGMKDTIEVIPGVPAEREAAGPWPYDEATCSQLVYVYGEIGYKYRGAAREFFNLYGRRGEGDDQPGVTIASVDIGAGTTDLMVCRYTCREGEMLTEVRPEPLFHDSFYYAGDDMLYELMRHTMFVSPHSAYRRAMQGLDESRYRQRLRNIFGPDHAGQTVAERRLRRDLNMQYSVPLMQHFLELLAAGSPDCVVTYADLSADTPPAEYVRRGMREALGIDLEQLQWEYHADEVGDTVTSAFEPLLGKIATMVHALGVDIVLLSGRPASLPPVRDIFLKHYSVTPDRLILLNRHYTGHWYPFTANTGRIADAKSIVAVGALVGRRATRPGGLEGFVLDTSALDRGMLSTVRYVEVERQGVAPRYVLTPEQPEGTLTAATLPVHLRVRRLGVDSYPSRPLYVIDYDEARLADTLRRRSIAQGDHLSDAALGARLRDELETLRRRLPYSITLSRDIDRPEHITILSATDREGNDLPEHALAVTLRSLDAAEGYWLDTGAFTIQ